MKGNLYPECFWRTRHFATSAAQGSIASCWVAFLLTHLHGISRSAMLATHHQSMRDCSSTLAIHHHSM